MYASGLFFLFLKSYCSHIHMKICYSDVSHVEFQKRGITLFVLEIEYCSRSYSSVVPKRYGTSLLHDQAALKTFYIPGYAAELKSLHHA
jgi:hypothetical protein